MQRLAFVHIPKTAGTTVSASLDKCVPNELICPASTIVDYPNYSTCDFQKFVLFRGHTYRRDYQRFPTNTIFLTIFRNPVERFLSIYHYIRGLQLAEINDSYARECVELARTRSALEFLYSASPAVVEQLRFGQMRQFLRNDTLAELAHRQFSSNSLRTKMRNETLGELEQFQYVITTQHLSVIIPYICENTFCVGDVEVGHENVSVKTNVQDLSEIRRGVVDVNDVEFDIYDYVCRRENFLLDKIYRSALKNAK